MLSLKDRYICNVPFQRVPQIQSASPTTSHESSAPKTGIPLPGYIHVPSWIPMLPKLGSIPQMRGGQNLMLILSTLGITPCVRYAIASRMYTDSLAKRM